MLVKEKGRWAVFQERGACFFRGSVRLPFEMDSMFAGYNKGFDKT